MGVAPHTDLIEASASVSQRPGGHKGAGPNRYNIADLREAIAYDPETGDLTWLTRDRHFFPSNNACAVWNSRWAGKPALTSLDNHGYRCGNIFGRSVRAHRLIWAVVTGKWPRDSIDHVNGVRHDNRFTNLQEASHTENMRNSQMFSTNTSGFNGVCFKKERRERPWRARIGDLTIGYFDTPEAAASARKAANRQLGYSERHGLPCVATDHNGGAGHTVHAPSHGSGDSL